MIVEATTEDQRLGMVVEEEIIINIIKTMIMVVNSIDVTI